MSDQRNLFGDELHAGWLEQWQGMPEFVQDDTEPYQKITVSFASREDVESFAKLIGQNITERTDSLWHPRAEWVAPSTWSYSAGFAARWPRYPIYIPSKGRWDNQLTSRALDAMSAPHYVVVEPVEADRYRKHLVSHAELLVLPFSDLGQGSIPARNWIWENAKASGFPRHWLIDDNIIRFYRLNRNRRIPVDDATIFVAAEDFTDRYDNVAFSGLNNIAFAPDRSPTIAPFTLNTRIYSMTLIKTDLELRWRGRYNEDTDLCLRALKQGLCTIQFNAFLGDKKTTMTQRGGNTDTVYADDPDRRKFAESLKAQHPDCVEIVWKFGRWHHQVDYARFARNKLQPRPGLTIARGVDNYGLALRRRDAPVNGGP